MIAANDAVLRRSNHNRTLLSTRMIWERGRQPLLTPMKSNIRPSSFVGFALASVAALVNCVSSTLAQDPFTGFANKGLVGVGRVPANSFDRVRGHRNLDTLGGIFSAMYFDESTLRV